MLDPYPAHPVLTHKVPVQVPNLPVCLKQPSDPMNKADTGPTAEDAHCTDEGPDELVACIAVWMRLSRLSLSLLDADTQQHLRRISNNNNNTA